MKKKITQIFSKIKPIKGIYINTANIGIKSKAKQDVALVSFKELANVATVLTKSKTYAPNIKWLKNIKNNGKAKLLFVNSGNANAYTGKQGYQNDCEYHKQDSSKILQFFEGACRDERQPYDDK